MRKGLRSLSLGVFVVSQNSADGVVVLALWPKTPCFSWCLDVFVCKIDRSNMNISS